MNTVPDRQIDPDEIYFPPDVPDGITVISELKNELAMVLVADTIYGNAGHGRNHIETIIKHALVGDAPKTLEAVRAMILAAGESEYAQQQWLDDAKWVDGYE